MGVARERLRVWRSWLEQAVRFVLERSERKRLGERPRTRCVFEELGKHASKPSVSKQQHKHKAKEADTVADGMGGRP